MKKIYFTAGLLVCVVFISFGQKKQDEPYDGYVITQDNVLIKGYLDFVVGNDVSGRKILLCKQRNFSPREFYTLELDGYAYKKDTFRIFNNLQPFLDEDYVIARAESKVIVSGKLVLYETYGQVADMAMPIMTGAPGGAMNTTVTRSRSSFYVVQSPTGELIGIKPENFLEEIHRLVYDVPDLLKRIDEKVLRFKHLEKIISEYNAKF